MWQQAIGNYIDFIAKHAIKEHPKEYYKFVQIDQDTRRDTK